MRVTWTFWLIVFVFNIGDIVGKWIAGKPWGFVNDTAAYIITYGRFIFILTANLIKFKVSPSWLFDSDWFKLLNLSLFAISNGYCITIMAMKLPSKAPDDKKEDIIKFLGIFILSGLVIGGFIGVPLANI